MSKPCCRNLFRSQICFAIWLHLSTGRRDCTHGKAAQDWIVTNCSKFIGKDEWPPNSPDLNPLDYHIWELYSTWMVQVISTQPENIDELSSAVDMWPAATGLDQQSHIELSEKTSGLCESWWTLRTYAKMNYLSDFGICNNCQCFLTIKITSCCYLYLFPCRIENMA